MTDTGDTRGGGGLLNEGAELRPAKAVIYRDQVDMVVLDKIGIDGPEILDEV